MTGRINQFVLAIVCLAFLTAGKFASAQSVCLPAPRLLTTMPMGGTVGQQVEITITGDHIDDADELIFSDPRITATRKLGADGKPVPLQYVVSIPSDCPVGLYDSRLMTRLGMSSSRVFAVGDLPEVVRTAANTTLPTAMELKLNSVCNAVMSPRAIDYYSFEAHKGQRILVDCASRGIDSKLDAVLIIANMKNNDLKVERQNGYLDFTAPEDGKYIIKAHELTFNGGPAFYYRLTLRELAAGEPITRHPSTRKVSSFSWPPAGLAAVAESHEAEPNNDRSHAQKITLPCDIAGSFYPAADVDVFEFEAKKGDVWWVEVASERLGRPTDPMVVVQHVKKEGELEKLTDVAEFNDIPSPVKVSSFFYSYDGPPYDTGSPDVLAKLEIKEDGIHRLQLNDLFGATRNDPSNIYRLVIRKAAPDFAAAAWGLHMELRNGDRANLSKPIALRGGSTIALEVITFRRDGFNDDIEMTMEGLPQGVTAKGIKIPAGKNRGILCVTAHRDAPRCFTSARIVASAVIDGHTVSHDCALASMAWPIVDAWNEIPSPRLLADVPVSVSGFEFAPVSIAPAGGTAQVYEAQAGEKLTIPLSLVRRNEFSAAVMQTKTFGNGFEQVPVFETPLNADFSQAVLDLAALKTPPGDYTIAFYGGAVAKYRKNPEAVTAAEMAQKNAESETQALVEEAKKLAEQLQAATAETKAEIEQAIEAIKGKQKAAEAALAAATEQLKRATQIASPVDIVDIVVSEPISIRVKPVESK